MPAKKGETDPAKGKAEAKTNSVAPSGPAMLASPTLSIGPTWDGDLTRLEEDVQTAVQQGPEPSLNNTPIHFDNPGNQCYRNAMMVALMYTPQFMGYVQRWHMDQEYPQFVYRDHILQALDRVGKAYHGTDSAGNRQGNADARLKKMWQLFRGAPSSVGVFDGALPEEGDGEQEDSTEWLQHLLDEIKKQLKAGVSVAVDDDDGAANFLSADDTEEVFRAMFTSTLTNRTRCPGIQTGICTKPHQKQRRNLLDDSEILTVTVIQGDDLTLRQCIEYEMAAPFQGWCGACSALGHHLTYPQLTDKVWRRFRDYPEVLFMKLRRYETVWENGKSKAAKITRPVTIPEILDISDFLEYHNYGDGSRVEYELKAMVSHKGKDLNSGHYVAFVKTDKKWWRVDDMARKTVTASSIEEANNFGKSSGKNAGKPNKPGFIPYVLVWVKTREDIVPPTRGAGKTAMGSGSKAGKPTGKGNEAGKNEGEHMGPKEGGNPTSTSTAESEAGYIASAAKDKVSVKITLYVGDDQAPHIVRGVINCPSECGDSLPISGVVRFVDDKGESQLVDFANNVVASLKGKTPPKKAATPPTKPGLKRAEPGTPDPKKTGLTRAKQAETPKKEDPKKPATKGIKPTGKRTAHNAGLDDPNQKATKKLKAPPKKTEPKKPERSKKGPPPRPKLTFNKGARLRGVKSLLRSQKHRLKILLPRKQHRLKRRKSQKVLTDIFA